MAKIRMLLGWPLENLEVPVDDDDVGVVDRRALCLEQSCSCGAAHHHNHHDQAPCSATTTVTASAGLTSPQKHLR
ncbi:hypothetical protein MCOR19_010222 [Pyricularia oryzae]|nr:hypothetical protein MCOR19_010222 [Pyricularia oryzae]KAI6586336.1 hypothetical protein MCOR06_006831 [Pyricularia oryzae]